MAIVKCSGVVVSAIPISQFDNGDWLLESLGQGPRFERGTSIRVPQKDVMEMAAAEIPAAPVDAPADAPPSSDAVVVSSAQAPSQTPTLSQKDNSDMTKLTDLADLAASAAKDIDSEATRAHDRLLAAKGKAFGSIAKIDGVSAQIEKGVAAVEDMANQLSNSPLDGK